MECPFPVVDERSRGYLGREPTIDERELVQWMRKADPPRRILHVGVGNSLMFLEFGAVVVQGMTKDGGEAAHSRSLGVDCILCNKYDTASYRAALRSPFDCIVDVNIRSFACCDRHFLGYMSMLKEVLAPQGMLLTSLHGLAWRIPTTRPELEKLCPEWGIRSEGSVVVMRPR
jgi:hypothetical protein